jgi:hypothetical protein
MTTNIQSFAGDVKIDNGNLSVKSLEVKDNITKLASNNSSYSNVGILMTRKGGASNVALVFNEDGSNVLLGYTNDQGGDDQVDMLTDATANLVVYGNVYVTGSFVGDGASLTGLVTDLQSVTEFGASTDQTIAFTNDVTGINVSSNVLVSGNVTANVYFGDGGFLSNITQTLEGITAIGNTTPYTIEFNNDETSFVTASNVGIANTNPTADLCVGANVVIDDDAMNVVDVSGNVACHQLNLGSIEILPAYSLEQVTGIGNTTTNTLSFNHSTLAFDTQKMAGIGIIPSSADVGVSGLHVDGHLRLGGEADNTDNELMYIKSAGALGVLANESDTNNTNTKLRLQSGETYNSNITMVGKSSAQYMTFGTNTEERMRIDSSGNIGIGTTNPGYKLDVHGTSNVGALTVTSLFRGVTEVPVRWNSQNETVFPQSATTVYYKLATLGSTSSGSNGGKLRISGAIGGFVEQETTLIDAFVASRGGISYGGTLTGYGGDPTDDTDLVVYQETDGTFAVWIKLTRFFTFDLTLWGGQTTGNSRTIAVLPCPTTNTSVATPTGTLEGSIVDACSVVFKADGNVGIGTTSPEYTLDVAGTSNAATYYQNGVELYAQRRWEVDLTGQSTDNFYPVELKHPYYEGSPDLPDMFPVHFKVFGESLTGSDAYNENTLVGYARGGGYSDHSGMYDVHYRRFTGTEKRFEGLYEGTDASSFQTGIVIYMRGGYTYSVLTDATEVNTYTSAQTLDNAVFAIKDVDGADVSGTSANIERLAHLAGTDEAEKRFMSGNLQLDGLDVVASAEGDYIAGFKNSATNGDQDARILIETSDGDGEAQILLQTTDESTTHKWNISAASGITPSLALQYNSDFNGGTAAMTILHGGNVGIGTVSPQGLLHISSGTSGDCVLRMEADTDNNNEADNPRIEFITDGGLRTALVGAGQLPFSSSNYNALVLAALETIFYTGVQDFNDESAMLERMRIDSSGNVGIGTTNPQKRLHIKQSIKTSQGPGNAIRIEQVDGGEHFDIGMDDDAAGADLYFKHSSGVEFIMGTDNGGYITTPSIVLTDQLSTDPSTYEGGAVHLLKTAGTNGGISQISNRGGLAIGSGDDRLILGAGDNWWKYDSTSSVGTEQLTLASDFEIEIRASLQNNNTSWDSEYQYFTKFHHYMDGRQSSSSAEHFTYYRNHGGSVYAVGYGNADSVSGLKLYSDNDVYMIESDASEYPFRWDVNADIAYLNGSQIHSSDDRLKFNEARIVDATRTLMKLDPQTYDKKRFLHSNVMFYESGFIAQDVWYDAPELRHLVTLSDDAEPSNVRPYTPEDIQDDPDWEGAGWGKQASHLNYTGMIPHIVKSIQEIATESPREKTRVVDVTGADDISGLVVSATTDAYTSDDKPILALSNVYCDRACFGVVSDVKPVTRLDSETLVNTRGIGRVWVLNATGTHLAPGDYVTTSNLLPGYAQIQADDITRSSTVAKITQVCDFTERLRPKRVIKQALSNVNYYVKTNRIDITEEEYNALDEENRESEEQTYYEYEATEIVEPGEPYDFIRYKPEITTEAYEALSDEEKTKYKIKYVKNVIKEELEEPPSTVTYETKTRTIYRRIVRQYFKTKARYRELEVRQELVNVLDEHGQLQWEDHPTETEEAYKIRYLDASGQQTDEANAVHIAAFVGCTYHCG